MKESNVTAGGNPEPTNQDDVETLAEAGNESAIDRLALMNQLHDLFKIIEPHYPPDHEIPRHFRYVLKSEIDNYVPPLDELGKLNDRFFFKLPLHEQIRAMNGWLPDSRIVTMPDWRRYTSETLPSRVLHMEVNGGVAQGIGEYAYLETIRPVHVLIRAGATKAETLNDLETITDHIRLNWDALIKVEPRHPDDLYDKEEADKPEPVKPPDPEAVATEEQPYDQDNDWNWKATKEAWQGYPMIAPRLAELEKIAGDTPVHIWLAAALYNFLDQSEEGGRQDALAHMLCEHSDQECKLAL